MAKYCKKPIVIEAEPCDKLMTIAKRYPAMLPEWFKKACEDQVVTMTPQGILIKTLEGEMLAGPSDMVICGVKKEIYPCKRDIFDESYTLQQEFPPSPSDIFYG